MNAARAFLDRRLRDSLLYDTAGHVVTVAEWASLRARELRFALERGEDVSDRIRDVRSRLDRLNELRRLLDEAAAQYEEGR